MIFPRGYDVESCCHQLQTFYQLLTVNLAVVTTYSHAMRINSGSNYWLDIELIKYSSIVLITRIILVNNEKLRNHYHLYNSIDYHNAHTINHHSCSGARKRRTVVTQVPTMFFSHARHAHKFHGPSLRAHDL